MYRIVPFNVCAIGVFAFSKVFFFVLIYEIVYRKSWDMAFSSSWEGMPPDSLGYQLVTFLIHAYYIKLYTQPRSQGLSSLSSSHPLELQGEEERTWERGCCTLCSLFPSNFGREGHFSSILWCGTAWLAKGVAYNLKRLGMKSVQNAPWSV